MSRRAKLRNGDPLALEILIRFYFRSGKNSL